MENKISKKIGKAVIGFFIVAVTTSGFAFSSNCTIHSTCVGDQCAHVKICTN
jgi:hypothetical protein